MDNKITILGELRKLSGKDISAGMIEMVCFLVSLIGLSGLILMLGMLING